MANSVTVAQPASPKLKLAFCLYKYFPYGGLQRDFLRIALECQRRGHDIRVYTLHWQGEPPQGFDVIQVPVRALTNHGRNGRFHRWTQRHLAQHPVDRVVGFNKMPGLDIYYAADPCYEDKARTQRHRLYRFLPRYRSSASFERAVFGHNASTEILMLASVHIPVFSRHYQTQEARFHLLPPGIAKDRMAPPNRQEVRADFRREFGLADTDQLLLLIGSGFVTKGLDRALLALAALPPPLAETTRLFAVGEDKPASFRRQAARLGLSDRVTILGGRSDIPRFLQGGDLLVHPAYSEAAGMVLLEAVIAGLPVLATDVCGYAHYIEEAKAGRVIPSPFRQETMNQMLAAMLASEERQSWSQNGIAYGRAADIYDMPQRAADFITSAPSQAGAAA